MYALLINVYAMVTKIKHELFYCEFLITLKLAQFLETNMDQTIDPCKLLNLAVFY